MTRSNCFRRFLLAAIVVCAPLLAACSAPGTVDNSTAPVSLILSALAQSTEPFGDVVTDDGGVAEDQVAATFVARLKGVEDITTPPLQDIIIERYEVTFTRTDGGTAVPAGFQRAMNAKVQVTGNLATTEQETIVTLMLVSGTQKLQPPLSHLISPGFEPATGFTSIQADARLRFFGRTIAGEQVVVEGSIAIEFANYADVVGENGKGAAANRSKD